MTLLITIHVLVAVALVGIILLQPGKSEFGIGFGSSSQSIFGSRGAGNFMTKITAVCATVFIATSFIIAQKQTRQYRGMKIEEAVESTTQPTATQPSGKETIDKAKPTTQESPTKGPAKPTGK